MKVNELIQTACEDLGRVGDGETVSGDLAASCEGLLNRAITELHQDGYIAVTTREHDVTAAGKIYFRKLVVGEAQSPNVIDSEPPDSVSDVARKVGIRWMRLRGMEISDIRSVTSGGLPQAWTYQTTTELAPNDTVRQVGVIDTNGTAPTEMRVFVREKIPAYRIGDTIYLSDLYRNLILYALEVRICKKYKLYSYLEQAQADLLAAKDSIDTNKLANAPDVSDASLSGSYLDSYYDGLGGVGY